MFRCVDFSDQPCPLLSLPQSNNQSEPSNKCTHLYSFFRHLHSGSRILPGDSHAIVPRSPQTQFLLVFWLIWKPPVLPDSLDLLLLKNNIFFFLRGNESSKARHAAIDLGAFKWRHGIAYVRYYHFRNQIINRSQATSVHIYIVFLGTCILARGFYLAIAMQSCQDLPRPSFYWCFGWSENPPSCQTP